MSGHVTPPASAPPRRRALLAWTGIVAGVLAVGTAAGAIGGISTMPAMGLLDPEAAGPDGARAIVEILRDQGVRVEIARDRGTAVTALERATAQDGAHEDAVTLAIADTAPLDDEDLTALSGAAGHTVLLQPRARDLRLLVGDATSAGFADGTVDAACPLPAATGPLVPGEVFDPGSADLACYPADGGYGLVVHRTDGRTTTALDATAVLTNAHLAEAGHAALGLGLLGTAGTVVWYVPALGDGSIGLAPTLGELTPPWVTPAIVVLVAALIAAIVWRGRRFGPLVAENLPVTVRGNETTEGRARLYARTADPVHALDQLRRGSLHRAARLLGLGPGADPAAVADAVAGRLNAPRAQVRAVLLDDAPRTDRDLVDAADRLRRLDDDLRDAVRPERNNR